MEDIITQTFNYADITPYKNYCKIGDRRKHEESLNSELDSTSFFSNADFSLLMKPVSTSTTDSHYEHLDIKPKLRCSIFSLPEKTKKKTKFFSTKDPIQEKFTIEYAYYNKIKHDNTFQTTNDRHIKQHYGNSFSRITVHFIERSIRRYGDKVTIKVYKKTKDRNFNDIYFKSYWAVKSLTINLKTGNFTIANIDKNAHKSKTTRFRSNSLVELYQLLAYGLNFFNLKERNIISKKSTLYDDFFNVFNDVEFNKKIQETLNLVGDNKYCLGSDIFIKPFVEKFIELKNIKVPNGDCTYLLSKFYPTEKYLKKNERKLIASILDMVGMKSKIAIKILHNNPEVDLYRFFTLCSFFGENYNKYIGSIDSKLYENDNFKIKGSYFSSDQQNVKSFIGLKKEVVDGYVVRDVEKENIVKIINSGLSDPFTNQSDFLTLLHDHFRMISKVRKYDDSVYMRARTMSEFHKEHQELSKMVAAIKKGWVIEYKFDKKLIDDVESNLECLFDDTKLHTLYPYILKREEDYVEEGLFMHHCVASYADKGKSVIISLRSEDTMERVTCEFEIQTGRQIQARYFCNKVPPKEFEDGLLLLQDKIRLHARWGTLNWLEKIKVPVKINGIEIEPEKKEPVRFGNYALLENDF